MSDAALQRHRARRRLQAAITVVVGAVTVACVQPPVDVSDVATPAPRQPTTGAVSSEAPATPPASARPEAPASARPPRTLAVAPPRWLGRRVLPRRPDGFGQVRATPPILRNRRFATRDVLPPPRDERFTATVSRIPDSVVERSTWSAACPVSRAELRYVTVAFWGFDDRPHTGELIVHAAGAEDIVGVFRRLHRARFPIEEMRVVRREELDAPPTGDGNNTTSFVCRPSRQSTRWSRHAFGLAVDVNPFHNPYVKDGLVLPELASVYADRSRRRPGMIHPGDEAVAAFAAIGWGWGGEWRSLKDWMHFSDDGT